MWFKKLWAEIGIVVVGVAALMAVLYGTFLVSWAFTDDDTAMAIAVVVGAISFVAVIVGCIVDARDPLRQLAREAKRQAINYESVRRTSQPTVAGRAKIVNVDRARRAALRKLNKR